MVGTSLDLFIFRVQNRKVSVCVRETLVYSDLNHLLDYISVLMEYFAHLNDYLKMAKGQNIFLYLNMSFIEDFHNFINTHS